MTRIDSQNKAFFNRHRDALIGLFLMAATFTVYWQIISHDFVRLDDNLYVLQNRPVQAGLTLKSVIWAFTDATREVGFWHPLTWLSHMLDSQLYGLNPGWHHLTSLLFHMANTLLLFFVFRKMTRDSWASGCVAALFALHPFNVESVAWVAERRGVLCAFFWLLTMWAYVRYAETSGFKSYLLALLFFLMGLMSKPMIVTLPFVLLLMDYWPLGRLQWGPSMPAGDMVIRKYSTARLVWEKIPFFVLTAAVSTVTYIYHKEMGQFLPAESQFLKIHIANAFYSYASYIGKMIWPAGLAVYYPYLGDLPMWRAAGALLLLVGLSFIFFKLRRRCPYLPVGWLWFLGTLVPVIGFVKVCTFAMADRYTYIPLIGLYIIIAWGMSELASKGSIKKKYLGVSAIVICFVLMGVTWIQVRYWKDTITLYKHAIEVTSDNVVMHHFLGNTLAASGRTDDAIEHYSEALRIIPDYVTSHNNLGILQFRKGNTEASVRHFQDALRIKPDYEIAYFNLGKVLESMDDIDGAIQNYQKALQINPDYVNANNNLGAALLRKGNVQGAVDHFQRVLYVEPDHALARENLNKIINQK
jgi:tetratricopeptide (TPR) repeat protein